MLLAMAAVGTERWRIVRVLLFSIAGDELFRKSKADGPMWERKWKVRRSCRRFAGRMLMIIDDCS